MNREIHKNKRKTGGTVPRTNLNNGFLQKLKGRKKANKGRMERDRCEERREKGRKTEGDTKAKLLI